MLEDFTCPLSSIESLESWLSKEDDTHCPACLIAPLASYYVGILEEAGENKLADNLKSEFEKGDNLTIVKNMDTIKRSVGEKLKQNLEKLDCMAQISKDA